VQDVLDKARRIRLVVFDVDGVLTDGGIILDHEGREYKIFNSRDGHGMKMLRETGVAIAVITGRSSMAVDHRMSGLGVDHVFKGQQDKLPAFEALIGKTGIEPDCVACVGDDVVDLPLLRRAGLAIAVADAHDLVKAHAHWITANKGGHGAGREVCELIMTAQGTLDPLWNRYLALDD
jgi:3-deoxy-D-manno-octulosonate 8-phosphate phosphatase (KDO 8-P phosphatase)